MERTLAEIMAERVEQVAAVDCRFARDVGERVARFTGSGGKRMRAQFVWWAMRACGGGTAEANAALRIAAALELIQTCALVHDDVMDGSPRRRGGPSFHAQLESQYAASAATSPQGSPFAASAAILAGDLALVWADDVLTDTEFPSGARSRVLHIWRAMRTEMIAGQYLDLHGQMTGSASAALAIRTVTLKTALYSVERPLAIGAALAGSDARTARALSAAGRCAGIAFQLRDDLEGVFGDSLQTGKPSGDDVRAGKPTFLVTVARARAEARGDLRSLSVLDGALGDPGLSHDGLERVREVLTGTGARSAVEDKIERMTARSTRHLRAAALGGFAGQALNRLLTSVASTVPRPPAPKAWSARRPGPYGLWEESPSPDGVIGGADR
nr:polyprenyl synthetase family protein [Streptomyces armeniacus]